MNNNYIVKVSKTNKKIYENEYYNDIDSIKNLDSITLEKPVVFFVGENGTGKSTLLEAIAVAYGFNPEGGSINFNFKTNNTHSCLHDDILLVRGVKRPKDGFFLRAESFYNVATEIDELNDSANLFLDNYGGKSMHTQSHGESFLSLVEYRFRGNGFYILDEPEAALSPQRLLSLLIYINNLVKKNSQFIIVTHSPILLAYDNAEIYSFNNNTIEKVNYKNTDSYFITKSFLDNPKKMLKSLFCD
jgi:predicted ATPase